MASLSWIVTGDKNATGGQTVISITNTKVFINNLPVSVALDAVTPHGTPPLPGVTVPTQSKIFIQGKPVILQGDSDTPYGAKRLPSSGNSIVFVSKE